MSKQRPVLTEHEATKIVERARIKMDYPSIELPLEGPGLLRWTAIDCLTNRHRWIARRPEPKPRKKRKERPMNPLIGPNVIRHSTDRHDKGRKGEILISQLIGKGGKQCQAVMDLLKAFDIPMSDYEKCPI